MLDSITRYVMAHIRQTKWCSSYHYNNFLHYRSNDSGIVNTDVMIVIGMYGCGLLTLISCTVSACCKVRKQRHLKTGPIASLAYKAVVLTAPQPHITALSTAPRPHSTVLPTAPPSYKPVLPASPQSYKNAVYFIQPAS